MTTISKIVPTLVNTGTKTLHKSGIRKTALALAAAAAMIPAIANAKTSTVKEPAEAEKTVQVQESSSNSTSQQTYTITTTTQTSFIHRGLAYNTSGNQFAFEVGADYNYNPTTSLQELGPELDFSGRFGGYGHNFVFDANAKVDFPLNGANLVDVKGYANLGYQGDLVRSVKSRVSLGLGAEGYVELPLDENFNYRRFNKGTAGVGARATAEFSQGIGNDARLTLTADGVLGAKTNFIEDIDPYIDPLPDIITLDKYNPYARWGGRLKFDIGAFYLKAFGGYFYNLNSDMSVRNNTPYVGAGAGIHFGN